MTGPAATASMELELRVARLACMPADAGVAVQRFVAQLRHACDCLGGGAIALLHDALHGAGPLLPPLPDVRPASIDDLLLELERALDQHHPEEIRVASFTLLTSLVEVVQRQHGLPRVQALLRALESPRS
jgi:hypothetical protein